MSCGMMMVSVGEGCEAVVIDRTNLGGLNLDMQSHTVCKEVSPKAERRHL